MAFLKEDYSDRRDEALLEMIISLKQFINKTNQIMSNILSRLDELESKNDKCPICGERIYE